MADVKKVITESARAMLAIKAKRQELNEEAGEVRKRLRDHGIQTKAFEFAVKLQEMEQEARNTYMDDLRLSMESLGVGEQGSLLAPIKSAGA